MSVTGAAVGFGWSGCAEGQVYGYEGSLVFLQPFINDIG